MTAFLQLAAMVALGGAVALLWRWYDGATGGGWTPWLFWIGALLVIGYLVDRRAAKRDGVSLRDYWRPKR